MKRTFQDENGVYHYVQNNLSPLNSQAYLMQEAIKYGKELKSRLLSQQVNPFVQNVAVVG